MLKLYVSAFGYLSPMQRVWTVFPLSCRFSSGVHHLPVLHFPPPLVSSSRQRKIMTTTKTRQTAIHKSQLR